MTEDLDGTLAMLTEAVGSQPDYRFAIGAKQIAGIGDFCVQSAPPAEISKLREVVGPIVVDDLEQTTQALVRRGSVIESDVLEAPTGRLIYTRSPEGVAFEWLQFTPELVSRLIEAPQEGHR